MRIMVDTNVIMDILQRREPFFTDSYQAVHSIIKEDGECMLSASAATDIFYMLRKALQSPQQARERLAQLAQLVTFADVAGFCLLYTSPSPRDGLLSRMPSSA